MKSISVVISAYNEEKNIEDCLKSAKLIADEIIVINNNSSDKTVEITKKFTDSIFSRPNDPVNLNKNKNFGFSHANKDWILSLDADERITKELALEIKNKIKLNEFTAYKIPRKNIIFKKWIAHTGWYPDYQIRLFKKGKGKFPEKHVHELLKVDGKIGVLSMPIHHENYKSISQFISKLNAYTDSEANKIIGEKKDVTWKDALRYPAEEFYKRFFINEGYKDGTHGLVLSLLMAFYWEVVFAKVWEKKDNFKDSSPPNFLDSFSNEIKKIFKEIKYWIYNSKEKEYPAKKIFYKFKRKLF